ncbi:hypothetical protein F0267_20925, partial [Vibrio coralliilyticus]
MNSALYLLDLMYLFSQITIVPIIFVWGFIVFRKGFSKFQLIFLLPLILFLITTALFPYLARENVKNILSENILIFDVTGFEDENKILTSLRTLKFVPSNNSHPVGGKIDIKIVTNETRKNLFMYKDYLMNNKYWLYDDEYRYSTNNNIG